MRIICPTCASHYEVECDKIGAEGQLVRCAECREVWLVRAPAADIAAERAASAPPPARDPMAFAAAFKAHAEAQDAPIDFEAARQRLRGGLRRGRTGRTGSAALLTTAALCATALGLGVGLRSAITTRIPAAAGLYAAIGLPSEPQRLALRDVHSVVTADGSHAVLSLEGRIANLSDGPTTVPNITVVVRDGAETPLYTWTTAAPKAQLAKGETVAFRSRLAAPPTQGHDVRVSFADASTMVPPRP